MMHAGLKDACREAVTPQACMLTKVPEISAGIHSVPLGTQHARQKRGTVPDLQDLMQHACAHHGGQWLPAAAGAACRAQGEGFGQ